MSGVADGSSGAAAEPLLRIVRGNPTAEEVAALVAVVAAAGSSGEGSGGADREMSSWADRGRLLRQPLEHGPHAWRSSALPR